MASLMKTFLLVLIISSSINSKASINTSLLEGNTWKFHYAFKPTEMKILNKASEDNYTYIKFIDHNTFSLVSNDYAHTGIWSIKASDNGTAHKIIFNFESSEEWSINYLNKNNFVIHDKNEEGLIEYHFQPASSEKDMRFFALKLDEHIQYLQKIYNEIQIIDEDELAEIELINTIDRIRALDGNKITSLEEKVDVLAEELATIKKGRIFKRLIAKRKIKYAPPAPDHALINKRLEFVGLNGNDVLTSDPIYKYLAPTKLTSAQKNDYIEIYVSGGGFKSGVNPILRDEITIDNTGFIQKLYKSKLGGEKSYEKHVTKEELVDLANEILNLGFFDLEDSYECHEGNERCFNAFAFGPKPNPLKMVISIGQYRHIVSIPLFAPGMDNNLLDYPKNVEKIMNTIQEFASL